MIRIHVSAYRHGISKEDINHALVHTLITAEIEPDSDPPKTLFIGADMAGNLLEVITIEGDDGLRLVIHAMTLRPTFKKWLER